MKHLLITNDFPPFWAGEAQYYYNIWNNFSNKSEVVILCPKIPGCEEFDRETPFKIYRGRGLLFPGFFGRILKPFIYLVYSLKIIKKEQIRLVHCGNLLAAFLSGMVLNKAYGIPYYVYIFAEDLRGYGKIMPFRKLFIQFLNNAKRIIAISEFSRDRFIQKGVRQQLFTVIYPGVDLNKFRPGLDSSPIINKYKLKDKRIILSVGRLVRRKGFDMVIKALPKVLQSVPNAIYLICGRGYEYTNLKRLAKKLGVEDKVFFLGYKNRDELPLYYNLCDIFVMPSREYSRVDAEGFGIVFLEAGACERPVIGGKSGGIPEAIIDGKTGFLINPLDIEDIAYKIISVLKDRELARRLGQEARKMVLDKFKWQYWASALEEVIKDDFIK